MRISTWAMLAAFALLAVVRRDRTPLLAAWIWLSGFEATFQAVSLAAGRPLPAFRFAPAVLIAVGTVTVAWSLRHGIVPSSRLMGLAVLLWIAWIATGFDVNDGHHVLHPFAEALNEGAKSAWALAYLWPLRRRPVLPKLGLPARKRPQRPSSAPRQSES
jgi:hypothetical protein